MNVESCPQNTSKRPRDEAVEDAAEEEDAARKKLELSSGAGISLCEVEDDRGQYPSNDEISRDSSSSVAQRGGILSCRINQSGVPRQRMTRFCFISIDDDRAFLKDLAFPGCPEWCKGLLLTFCQVHRLRSAHIFM